MSIDRVDYINKHKDLHNSLDILIAEFMQSTYKLISESTILELLEWSYKQTVEDEDIWSR